MNHSQRPNWSISVTHQLLMCTRSSNHSEIEPRNLMERPPVLPAAPCLEDTSGCRNYNRFTMFHLSKRGSPIMWDLAIMSDASEMNQLQSLQKGVVTCSNQLFPWPFFCPGHPKGFACQWCIGHVGARGGRWPAGSQWRSNSCFTERSGNYPLVMSK